MFKNYFNTSFRHFLKNKINLLFKIGGLTLALFNLLIITVYIQYQLSFDTYHQDFENTYRVNSNRYDGVKFEQYGMVPSAIGPALKAEFPEVMSFSRITEAGRALLKYDEKLLRISGLVEADSSVFDVLSFVFLQGDKRALNAPGSIVLTSSLAKRIFGNENPIGKSLTFPDNGNKTLTVSAIIQDLPPNTHLTVKAITLLNAFREDDKPVLNSWEITWDGSVNLYVHFNGQVDPNEFSEKSNRMIQRHIAKRDDGNEKYFSIFLQPVAGIYLGDSMQMEFFKKGSKLYLYIFSLLGVFLLVMASLNYVNLSIADFHNRRKEIGVRKILGAQKIQIAFFVAAEGTMLCLGALLIGLVGVYFFFPQICGAIDPNLQFAMLLRKEVIIPILLLVLLISIFSTAYPAHQLSTNRPLDYLRKEGMVGNKLSAGKMLLFFQFIISVFCISATFIISNQLDYIRTSDIGYDRHNVITLIMPEEFPSANASLLKNELNKVTGVASTSFAYYHMTGVPYFKGQYEVEIGEVMRLTVLNEVFVDHDFVRTMNIRMLFGRNFDVNNLSDTRKAFIVNETAVKEFGWTDPLGKKIRLKQTVGEREKWEGTVIGVVQDFNTRPLREKIEPLVLRLQYDSWPGYCLNVRIDGEMNETLSRIKSAYEKVIPGSLIDYRIIEEMYDQQYKEEARAFTTLRMGTWVIVMVSALGIFSLSMYMSVKRMKEFGIRRVLGASGWQITFLHVGGFMKIALLANIFGLPAAYLMMDRWLNGFAYRTEFEATVWCTTMAILFLLVIVSAAYPSLRAGSVNPVEIIKD